MVREPQRILVCTRALAAGACCLIGSYAALEARGCQAAAVRRSAPTASAAAPHPSDTPPPVRPGLRAEAESDPLSAAYYLALKRQNPGLLVLAAERMGELGQRSRALEALDLARSICGRPLTPPELERGGSNIRAYDRSRLAAAYARLGKVAEGVKIADSIREFSFEQGHGSRLGALAKAEAQRAIAAKLAEMGDFDSALKLAESIQASKWIKVAPIGSAVAAGSRLQRVPDDTSKLGALVDICVSLAKAHKVDEARQTIDAITYPFGKARAAAAVSLVLDQQGQHTQAESLLDGAAAGAGKDAWLFVDLAQAYRRIGKKAAAGPLLDRAVRLVDSSGIEHGGAWLHLRVAEECFAAGRQQKAVKMLDETFRAVKTTKYEAVREQVELLKEAARISARAGRFERAREMAKAIGDDDYGDEALLEVVKAYADARMATQAYELARAIEYPDHRVAALAAAAGAWLGAGKRAEAAEALTLAMAALSKSLNPVHSLLEIEVRYREGGLLPDAAAKAALRELASAADRAATAPAR